MTSKYRIKHKDYSFILQICSPYNQWVELKTVIGFVIMRDDDYLSLPISSFFENDTCGHTVVMSDFEKAKLLLTKYKNYCEDENYTYI